MDSSLATWYVDSARGDDRAPQLVDGPSGAFEAGRAAGGTGLACLARRGRAVRRTRVARLVATGGAFGEPTGGRMSWRRRVCSGDNAVSRSRRAGDPRRH